jgi:hypothetical protein
MSASSTSFFSKNADSGLAAPSINEAGDISKNKSLMEVFK